MKLVTHIFLINSQDHSYIFSVLVQTLSSPSHICTRNCLKISSLGAASQKFPRPLTSTPPREVDPYNSAGLLPDFGFQASSRRCPLLGQALKMPNFPAHIRNCIYEPSLSPATVSLFLYSSEIRLGNEAGLSLLLDTTDVRKRLRT